MDEIDYLYNERLVLINCEVYLEEIVAELALVGAKLKPGMKLKFQQKKHGVPIQTIIALMPEDIYSPVPKNVLNFKCNIVNH